MRVANAAAAFFRAAIEGSRRWAPSLLIGMVDQGAVAGSSFILNVILARWMSAQEYGLFALTYSALVFLSGFHNSLVLEPMSVIGPAEYQEASSAYFRSLSWLNASFCIGLAGLLGAFSLFLSAGSVRTIVIALLLSSPPVLSLWFCRRFHYLARRPATAALTSFAYGLLLIAFTALLHLWNYLSLLSAFGAMGLAGATAKLISRPPGRDGFNALEPMLDNSIVSKHWQFGKWILLAAMLQIGIVHAQFLLAAGYVGLEAVGVLRASLNFAQPMAQMIIAAGLLGLPALASEYGRRNIDSFRRKGHLITIGLGIVATLYTIFLYFFRDALEQLIYGGKFAQYAFLIPCVGLTTILSGISTGYSLMLRAAQRPQHYLIVTGFTCAAGLPSAFFFTALWGLRGAVASVIFAQAICACVTILLYRRNISTLSTGSPQYCHA